MGGDKAAAAASGLVNADAQRVFFAGTGDHRLRGFMYAQIHLLFGAHYCATQGVGQHLGNFHVDELADHVGRALEVYHTVALRAPGQFHHAFARGALHQNALDGAEHAAAELQRLLVDAILQNIQPLFFSSSLTSSTMSAAGVPGRDE